MHDVQPQADIQPDTAALHNEGFDYSSFGTFAQEGYQPMGPADNASTPATYPDAIDIDVDVSHGIEQGDAAMVALRPRRISRTTPITTPSSSTRVARRPRGSRTSSYRNVGDLQDGGHAAPSTPAGPFPCPFAVYGCSSSFGSKNEWKRHVATQHIRLGFWRCDLCHRRNNPHDFYRKDLYIQHVRRMHAEELGLPPLTASKRIDERSHRDTSSDDAVLHEAASRCYVELRTPPEHSRCLFCDDEFHGSGSWEQRMEHISGHLEAAKKERSGAGNPSNWKTDEAVHNWLVAEGLIVVRGQTWVLADSGRRKSLT
ncbi:unnamed protein product [Zymoseptoria tritici ST99CH_1A5]|uniref:C2H2-type domain-containing protein n=3 Tax=Zymoseptoria tritici TaxID=1047171 RepID=A0A1X7RHG3_ZYMT9|nr:unnamed protein product [Zymoseptoria tritici ST99CH_3D7]SMR43207.1 unnamed protein product [Zymoseptoria tritici ST99CH_1E4]SMY20527.1 unnamed protein product [Zymoseptoria tritici ST99CH_1A5]